MSEHGFEKLFAKHILLRLYGISGCVVNEECCFSENELILFLR